MGLIIGGSRADGSLIGPKELTATTERPLTELKSFSTAGGYTFTFGSERDISVKAADGTLISTIEIKYGLDPAGALERYGAAKKSFEQATKENRRVHNIYLASCITPEVRNRIKEDRLVNEDFNLTEVLGDPEKRNEFLRRIERLVAPGHLAVAHPRRTRSKILPAGILGRRAQAGVQGGPLQCRKSEQRATLACS